MTTLIIDTGDDIIGVYSVEDEKFVAYRGIDIPAAIQRISDADEVVTYNGTGYDLEQLSHLAKRHNVDPIPLRGAHVDMQRVCWDTR